MEKKCCKTRPQLATWEAKRRSMTSTIFNFITALKLKEHLVIDVRRQESLEKEVMQRKAESGKKEED